MAPLCDPLIATTSADVGMAATVLTGVELVEKLDIKRADGELLLMEPSPVEEDGCPLPGIRGRWIPKPLHAEDALEAGVQDNRKILAAGPEDLLIPGMLIKADIFSSKQRGHDLGPGGTHLSR